MVLEQLDIHMQKTECPHRLYTLLQINSKWIIDLNVKCKSIKFLEDNIGKNLNDFGIGNEFLDTIL